MSESETKSQPLRTEECPPSVPRSEATTCTPIRRNADDLLDEQFERHVPYVEGAKAAYLENYREMIDALRSEHLDVFVNIMAEKEGLSLQRKDDLVATMKKGLLDQLSKSVEHFWQQKNVQNSLSSMEMLKEKFQNHEDKNWGMCDKTVEDRLLPWQMRFKDIQKRYLQKQLNFQSAQLEAIFKENEEKRARIQKVKQQQIYLRDKIEKSISDSQQIKEQLLRMQTTLLQTTSAIVKNEGDEDHAKENS